MTTDVECKRRGCYHGNSSEALVQHIPWPLDMRASVVRLVDITTGQKLIRGDAEFRLIVNATTDAHKREGRTLVGFNKDPTQSLTMFFATQDKADEARRWWAEIKRMVDGFRG